MEEILLIVDENNNPIGSANRKDVEQKGLIARVAHVILTDTNGRILCQKRAESAKVWPGCYTSTGSGHVDADETDMQAAIRELSEEAGIHIDESDLRHIDTSYLEHQHGNTLNKRFHVVYRATVNPSVSMNAELSEVSELRWFNPEEIVTILNTKPGQFTPTFERYFQMYLAQQ